MTGVPIIEISSHACAVEINVNRTRLAEYTGQLPDDPRYWRAADLRSAFELGLATVQTAHVGPKLGAKRSQR